MSKRHSVLTHLILATVAALSSAGQELHATKRWERPVLTINSKGAEGNKYGFEGGRVLKVKGTYHLFTSEMVADPHWVKMRLGHWISSDRINWERVATIMESSGDFTGKDQRAALWSPLPVFDPQENRWNLFYVAYQAAPDTSKQWMTNHEGRIWRAVSETVGEDGVGGPYRDVGVILQRGKNSDAWEGLQGTDSFFPYRVGDRWYSFYGSAHTGSCLDRFGRSDSPPLPVWRGRGRGAQLRIPWKIEARFIENPIATRLDDGSYVAVYEHALDVIGYTFSRDGVHWSAGQHLVVQTRHRKCGRPKYECRWVDSGKKQAGPSHC